MIALAVWTLLAAQDAVAPVAAFPQNLAEWRAGDREARWVQLERETLARGWRNAEAIAAFLEAEGEVELLEWLCLYPRTEGEFGRFSGVLAKLDAPQWARAVEWNLRDTDSHTFQGAAAAFTVGRPAPSLDWLARYATSVHPKAKAALEELRAREGLVAEDSSRWLPPLAEDEALAHLVAPGEVLDFGNARFAAPGATYLHQVERELRAIAHQQLFHEPWLGRVLELTRHARPEVRSFAWIALGEAQRGRIAPSRLPDSALAAVIDDASEDPRVRRAAAMALSQRAEWNPRAWSELHRLALEPAHAAWSVAVDRLRDVGDEMTIELLDELLPELPDDAAARLARSTVDALRARGAIARGSITRTLERTAFVDLACTSLETRRKQWTQAQFAREASDAGVKVELDELASTYATAEDLREALGLAPQLAEFGARVREWGRRLADGK